MKLKIFLVTIAVILTAMGAYLSWGTLRSVGVYLAANPVWIVILGIVIAIQLVGHVFRAARSKLVLDQAASSSLRFQFGALSIGYLFNVLLPFRLGELVRALLISRRLRISFAYTFTTIVLERAVDVLFIGFLVAVGALVIQGAGVLFAAAIIAIALAIAALGFIALLALENKQLLALIFAVSRLFNATIANHLRFKVWSLIFGLQSFFGNKKLLKRYTLYVLISWVCYFVSAAIIAGILLNIDSIASLIVAAVSPYVVTSVASIDLNSYQQIAHNLPAAVTAANLEIYAKIMWIVLILPMALIGVISLVLYKTVKQKDELSNPYVNKLLRNYDLSQEFPAFLETYFKGSLLSRILHKIEVNGELSLVRFFKGGSDAITVLALKDENMFVKKIVPIEFESRLRVQYDWLKKHANKKLIVDVLDEQKTNDYYAIDLKYNPENISLFEYAHTHSLEQTKDILDQTWAYVFKNIYSLKKEKAHTKERDVYIEDRLIQKMQKALKVNEDLRMVQEFETIIINGETYDNFEVVMSKIKNNKNAWADLALYRASDVTHGDLTVDNILVDPIHNQPFIIDPSDDNQLRGPIIDLARFNQSLAAGYEFLNNDEEPVKPIRKNGELHINYPDKRSARYMELNDHTQQHIMPQYFTPAELKTLPFHVGLLYGRMLAHRVVINPENTLKYYAICVVFMNRFYNQYK